MRSLVALTLALVGPAASALAVDITDCGQVVPMAQEGVLTVDLDCPRLPQGNPPAVTVQTGGTLRMNGHRITAPDNLAVTADVDASVDPHGAARHRFAVVGPGEITGSTVAIISAGRIDLTDLTIHDNQAGVFTDIFSKHGRIEATNVTITNSIEDPVGHGGGVGLHANRVIADGLTVTGATFDGIFVRQIQGRNVVASDNGPGYPTNGLGFGIVGNRVVLINLTANHNDGNGVNAARVKLRDSTVIGNTGYPTGDVDIYAGVLLRLRNTRCGKSNVPGACAGSPSGAFLDGAP